MTKNSTLRLWGGRFRNEPDARLVALSNAAALHARLIEHDIAGCIAHAAALAENGILSADEEVRLGDALRLIARDVSRGRLAPEAFDEDIHTFIERVLVGRIGSLGAKLRVGRSRNDQAANDLKRYLRIEAGTIAGALIGLGSALAIRAEAFAACPCPGFTHLQIAQPVTFGHLLMAHAQPLLRNLDRIESWLRRTATCPLGAAALAGTPFVAKARSIPRMLGYVSASENSIDAVAARDHVAEFLFIGAMIATDLSRLCEEITLWSSRQFRWIVLDDAFATGSSIMPQKKNPDIAEIARGRAARLIGHLVTMLTALKGLPLAYNRDLAEDKPAAFDTRDVLVSILPALTGLIETFEADEARMLDDAAEGFALATEAADYLARRGVPFAEAHEIAGALVRHAEERSCRLDQLDATALAAIDPRLGEDLIPLMRPESAIALRIGHGGTAPQRVLEQIARYRAAVAAHQAWVQAISTGASDG